MTAEDAGGGDDDDDDDDDKEDTTDPSVGLDLGTSAVVVVVVEGLGVVVGCCCVIVWCRECNVSPLTQARATRPREMKDKGS